MAPMYLTHLFWELFGYRLLHRRDWRRSVEADDAKLESRKAVTPTQLWLSGIVGIPRGATDTETGPG